MHVLHYWKITYNIMLLFYPDFGTPSLSFWSCNRVKHGTSYGKVCPSVTLLSHAYRFEISKYTSPPLSPPLDNIRVMVIVWRLRGNIIGTALCWVVDTMFTVSSTLI